jgi:hypothetical protein
MNSELEQLFKPTDNIKLKSKDWLQIHGILWKCDDKLFINKKFKWYDSKNICFSTFSYDSKLDEFYLIHKSKLYHKENKYDSYNECNQGPMTKEQVIQYIKDKLD